MRIAIAALVLVSFNVGFVQGQTPPPTGVTPVQHECANTWVCSSGRQMRVRNNV